MANQFVYDEGGIEISVWAEDREQTVEKATAALENADISLSEVEIDDRIRVIPSPRRSKSSADDVLMEMRRQAGEEAAERVEDGMTLGLGTGSTTAWAIAALGWKFESGELEAIRGAATSLQSHELAKEAGIPMVSVDQVETIDLAIDGADQWDPDHPHGVKGGGAAHAREKLIDSIVELSLVFRGVSDPDRRRVPVAGEMLEDALLEVGLPV